MPTKIKDSQNDPFLAFIGEETPEQNIVHADRSTLEAFMFCPFDAKQKLDRNVQSAGILAAIGEEVHQAFGRTILQYIESKGSLTPGEMFSAVMSEVRSSRPDIQPRVIEACKRSLRSWSYMIAAIDPNAIFSFDSGEKCKHPDDPERTRTGQLSWDIPFGHDIIRVTSELDLLHSTASPEVLREIDYKSGWKAWDYDSVFKEFQFCTHAWLVLNNYPEVNHLDVSVWATAKNNLTPACRFSRHNLEDYTARIFSAAEAFYKYHASTAPPAWPAYDKCRICDSKMLCPEWKREPSESPEECLRQLVALNETKSALEDRLKAAVDTRGEDVALEDGTRFGRAGPKSNKKQPAKIYQEKQDAGSDD